MNDKQKAILMLKKGQLEQAKVLFKRLSKRTPSDAQVWQLLGAINGMLGKYEEAESCSRRTVALDPTSALAHTNLGVALEKQGRLEEAVHCYREAIRLDSTNADAYFNTGNALKSLGRLEEAITFYQHALTLKPQDAEIHVNMGTALFALKRYADAIASYQSALTIQPGRPDVFNNIGAALAARGEHDEAVAYYKRALAIKPDYGEARNNLGNSLSALDRYEEATEAYRRAIALNPDYAEAFNNLGMALARKGLLDEATEHYRRAIALDPNYADAHNNLGVLLAKREQFDEATEHYRRAIALDPNYADAHNNLGVLLAKREQFDEATEHYRRAIALNPDYAEAFNNLGMALARKGLLDEATEHYRRAIALDPNYAEAHFNLSLIRLLVGDFTTGWHEYPWQWKREGSTGRPLPASPWNGNDLQGKPVFLYAEQGIGDEIFFLRFVPWLKHRGAGRVTYRPRRKIASLLERITILDAVVNPDTNPSPDDLVFSVGDLPRLLGMERTDQIPPSISLVPLESQMDAVRKQLAELGPPPYLGVTWRAGTPGKDHLLYKICPPGLLADTLRSTPATVLVLQRQPLADEIETFRGRLGRAAHDLSALNDNLEAMLALLALIDDYVGVSNTNMHLRVGVGRTARVLVPVPPEWRWVAEGRESPWFPGFGVYRQQYDGSWAKAFDMLTADLRRTYEH